MPTLTDAQIEALETAGVEVAQETLAVGGTITDEYGFELDGDWQLIRERAIAAGVAWDADDEQPDPEVSKDVWSAALRGYRSLAPTAD